MAPIVSLLYPITFFNPRTSPHLLNTPPSIFKHPTKEIFQLSTTRKPHNSHARRSNFTPLASNQPPPLNTTCEEGSEAGMEKSRLPKSYNTTLWGDYFHSFTPIENEKILENEHQILKESVSRELFSTREKHLDHLKLIDAIERLGVAYHFKDEIEESLATIYHHYNTYGDEKQYDLYCISLKFRVLRQHGFYVSSDCFKKFLDGNENFSDSLADDILGILSLFEASQFRVYREDVLEKALSFTTHHLMNMKMQHGNYFLEEINHALSRPLQKSLVRLEAKHHILMYQQDPPHSEVLLKFAKVDFNIVQSLHKKELQELTRWWKELCYAEKFPYARDRLVENYFVATSVLFEPRYSLSRMITPKVAVLMTVLDDIYDIRGTRDELEIFSEAIERWDKKCVKRLPDYMKVVYETLLDHFDQFENDLVEAGGPNYIEYLIEEVKVYARSHFKALKCREASNEVEYEEYLGHGMIGVGVQTIVASVLATMGEEVKEEDFKCFSLFPNVVRIPSIISKLLNDITGYETDKDEGGVSSIFCYMKQYGASREEACVELTHKIDEAWIEMNEEMCLYPRTRLRKLLYNVLLPTAQISNSIYDGEDGFRMIKNIMKDCITRMFVEPIIY